MTHDHGVHERGQPRASFPALRMALVLVGFILIAGVLLFTEHRAHVLGALIYLPLLLCPLMHFFEPIPGDDRQHDRRRNGGPDLLVHLSAGA